MVRLLLLALLFFLAYALCNAIVHFLPKRGSSLPREKTRRGEDMVQDPQCGTYIPRSEALEKVVKGKKYFFCSKECRDAFVRKSKKL
jgi:YHS domain-containing protein